MDHHLFPVSLKMKLSLPPSPSASCTPLLCPSSSKPIASLGELLLFGVGRDCEGRKGSVQTRAVALMNSFIHLFYIAVSEIPDGSQCQFCTKRKKTWIFFFFNHSNMVNVCCRMTVVLHHL